MNAGCVLSALLAASTCLPVAVHAYQHNFGKLSSIHAAVERNDAAFVAQWIREKRNVDEEYNDTRFCIHGCWEQMRKVTPLMVAADGGNLAIVKMLVEAGADVNRESTYPPSGIPNMGPDPPIAVFDYAVGSGSLPLVEYLARDQHLKRPPNLERDFQIVIGEACGRRTEREQWTQIGKFLLVRFGPASATGALRSASFEKCPVATRMLIDAGVRPDGESVASAAARGETALLRAYIATGVPIDEPVRSPDTQGRTPLMQAALQARLEAMTLLLEAGANPNAQDPMGMTALMHLYNQFVPAGDCGTKTAIVKLMLDHGARTDITDKRGQRIMNYVDRGGVNPCTSVLDLLTSAHR